MKLYDEVVQLGVRVRNGHKIAMKIKAAEEGRSVQDLLDEILKDWIEQQEKGNK